MGENILILAFVVIVIGGIGSIRGALVGAILVGIVDTARPHAAAARAARLLLPPQLASAAGPAIASIAIYVLMAVVLFFKPQGLFPARGMRHERALALPGCVRDRAAALPCAAARSAGSTSTSASPAASLIYAIAATSLNLVLGYGGMVSFGHAAFVGTRRLRRPAIAAQRRRASAWLAWPAAIAVAGAGRARDRRDLAAHARRLLHHDHARLRADAVLPRQLDEGLWRRRGPDAAARARRSASASTSADDARRSTTSCWPCSPLRCSRCTASSPSRFGRARARASATNEVRAEALGFPTFRYKLVVFVVAGAARRPRRRAAREPCRATSARTCCTGRSRAR